MLVPANVGRGRLQIETRPARTRNPRARRESRGSRYPYPRKGAADARTPRPLRVARQRPRAGQELLLGPLRLAVRAVERTGRLLPGRGGARRRALPGRERRERPR